MARPKKTDNDLSGVSIRLETEVVEKLDKYSMKIGISRTKLIANLVDAGLDDLYLMEKSGLLGLGLSISKFREKNAMAIADKQLSF